jgi:hypothetical protein
VNQTFLAIFLARIIFFLSIYGSIDTDLCHFTGLLGLAVALNGNETQPAEAEEPDAAPAVPRRQLEASV